MSRWCPVLCKYNRRYSSCVLSMSNRLSDLPGRRSLRSTHQAICRLWVAYRAFPVVGPRIWNDLLADE